MNSSRHRRLIVHLDAVEFGPRRPVGILRAQPGGSSVVFSFTYARSYLDWPRAFPVDPGLPLEEYELYGRDGGLFGAFADTAPDRWGRALLERREADEARRDARPVRTLDHWDFLTGVSDAVRLGALRFSLDADGGFIDARVPSVPPQTRLRELEAAARRIEESPDDDQAADALALLLAPGSSLGGTRPKANFAAEDGSAWIAKFPSRVDRYDVGAWQLLLSRLAARADIEVPEARLLRLASEHHTLVARRFDRVVGARRLFVSAMTLTGRRDGEGGSYLDLAAAVADHVAAAAIEADLEQLFRRLVFNVLVGNRDDHLRNHGFLRMPAGWRLAPAYDMNPAPASREHSLTIDGALATPDLDLVRSTADFYRLHGSRPATIIGEVAVAVSAWRAEARAVGIAPSEIDRMEAAFAAHTRWAAGRA